MNKIILFTFFLAIIGCASEAIKTPSASLFGSWEEPGPSSSNEVILVPQWHYSPQVNTRGLQVSLPQDKNQKAIFEEMSSWIRSHYIKNLIVEGCEGQLAAASDLRFNDWSLNDLNGQKNIENAQTHIGLKILSLSKGAINVECGDNLALIKEHQLALSDIRGLAGYKLRLEQANLPLKNRASFVAGAKEALKLPKDTKEDLVLKKLNEELDTVISHFESLVSKRNDEFVKKARSLAGRKVILIGALHIEDLKSKLNEQKIPFAIWRPIGLENGEVHLIEQLRRQLKLPSHH
ncbi:MAG TPA: hypothetical protein VIG33_17740 [Pseudobdellovibrionaceae bacterium]|jgi:hypothetical protein